MTNKPEKEFRGWFIPADIVRLFEDRKLTAEELILLITIDSLVSEKKGCWASNEFLHEKIHISENRISHMITKLKRMGLIVQIAFDGRIRYLETSWSRLDISKVNKFLKGKMEKASEQVSIVGNGEAELSPGASPNRVLTTTYSSSNKESTSPRPAESKDRAGFSGNGKVEEPKLDKFTKELATKVKATVKKHSSTNRMARAKIEAYAKCIRQLVHRSEFNKSTIREVIEWYCVLNNYSDKFTPKIRKSTDLYDNFDRVKEAMHRKEEESEVIFDHDDFEARVEKNADLIEEVRTQLTKMGHDVFGPPPGQEMVDEALVAIGYELGALDRILL